MAGNDWDRFDAAMRAFVEEFAAASAATEPEMRAHPRWVQRYDRYVREERPTYEPAGSVGGSAFQLKSFEALEPIFNESPLKPHLPGGSATSGPGPSITINPRDAAIRIAFRATKIEADKTHVFDRDSMEADIRSLHYLVEAATLRMELVGVLAGVQVTEKIDLRENVCVAPLAASEVESFIGMFGLPIILNQVTNEWETSIAAPVATLRLAFEQPRDRPMEDHGNSLWDEFNWFADAFALHHDGKPALFLRREWIADEFLRGGWSTTGPLSIGLPAKSEALTEKNAVIGAYTALRKLATSETYSNISLAIRRLGLTRTRANPEDVLIDAMIALEALLLADEKKERGDELSFRASLRASQWGALIGESGPEVFDVVSRAYGIRSRVVHGGSPKSDATFDIAGAKVFYLDVVHRVAMLARKFGMDALRRVLADEVDMRWAERLRESLKQLPSAPR